MAPPPSADAPLLSGALEAIQRERAVAGTDFSDELADRSAQDLSGLHCRNFLWLCESADIYDAVRQLIPDQAYWKKEEEHFGRMWALLRDHSELVHQRRIKVDEISKPKLKRPARPSSNCRITRASLYQNLPPFKCTRSQRQMKMNVKTRYSASREPVA
ncbi:hypothetical protein LTR85_012259 [Meristemomyces frigidus]|nr:hypothetical protein LTR85_012259 [Meristemomyces frigidus]